MFVNCLYFDYYLIEYDCVLSKISINENHTIYSLRL